MKSLLKDIRGNIALTTGILAVPLIIAAGGALDYAHVYNQQTSIQNALDAAVLATGRDMNSLTDDQLKIAFTEYLQANLGNDQYNQITEIDYNIDRNGGEFDVTINSSHPTTLLNVAGISELDFATEAAVRNGSLGGIEIIMALDTTGSMQVDNKIGDLRTAATNFTNDILQNNKVKTTVKVGIVPFSQYVNVGIDNRNESWLDVGDDTSENICQSISPVLSSTGCTSIPIIVDGVEIGTIPQCTNIQYGDLTEICETQTTNWNGCVGSRNAPLNTQDGSYGTRIPGILDVQCATDILPLTADRTRVLNKIDDLVPVGNTYMPAGVTWGLRAISDGAPFGQGVSYEKAREDDIRKIIILMTDGENTVSPNTPALPTHNGNNVALANQYTLKACNEAKEQDVIIYTIGFGDGITPETEDLMRQCSTDGENYLDADNANELQAAFTSISSQLVAVYLSR